MKLNLSIIVLAVAFAVGGVATAQPAPDPDAALREQCTAVIKTASAFQAATHYRVPPPDFGPLPQMKRTAK